MATETVTEEVVETTTIAAPQQQAPAVTVESLQAEISTLKGQLKNKSEEAERVHKKVERFEKSEKERADAELTELQKANKQLAELQTALQASKRAELQRAVADETGLPAAFASRIQGDDKDAMTADAKALLDAMPKAKPTATLPTNPAGAQTQGESDAERRKRLGLL